MFSDIAIVARFVTQLLKVTETCFWAQDDRNMGVYLCTYNIFKLYNLPFLHKSRKTVFGFRNHRKLSILTAGVRLYHRSPVLPQDLTVPSVLEESIILEESILYIVWNSGLSGLEFGIWDMVSGTWGWDGWLSREPQRHHDQPLSLLLYDTEWENCSFKKEVCRIKWLFVLIGINRIRTKVGLWIEQADRWVSAEVWI